MKGPSTTWSRPARRPGWRIGIIAVGDHVSFELDGVRHAGRVNRITRRATVLVEDPRGRALLRRQALSHLLCAAAAAAEGIASGVRAETPTVC